MYQQLWRYKFEEKLYLGVREQKRLNTTALNNNKTCWKHQRHAMKFEVLLGETIFKQYMMFIKIFNTG
jgi:hypothetical protein